MSNNLPLRGYGTQEAVIRQAERTHAARNPEKSVRSDGPSFQDILEREITFSKHANLRSEQRNIQLGSEQLQKLEGAVGKARAKGICDALIVMDGSAFIVNAGSSTVVTVMDAAEMKENVFTNIDGAVFV